MFRCYRAIKISIMNSLDKYEYISKEMENKKAIRFIVSWYSDGYFGSVIYNNLKSTTERVMQLVSIDNVKIIVEIQKQVNNEWTKIGRWAND